MMTWRRTALAAAVVLSIAALPAVSSAASADVAKKVDNDPFVVARSTGQPAEIKSSRSETDTVFANPNGTTTYEISSSPTRVKIDGAWTPIDLNLIKGSDGHVRPKAAPGDIELSGGGTGALESVTTDSVRTSNSFPVRLPAPTLDGPVALYSEVFPGVDLRMTVTSAGVSQVLVVKTAEAAKNPALNEIAMNLKATNGTVSEVEGRLSIKDEYGREVGAAPQPVMWDSSGTVTTLDNQKVGDTSVAAVDARSLAPTEGDKISVVPAVLKGGVFTMSPKAADLTGDGVTYPMYIDPARTPSRDFWAMVFKENPNLATPKWGGSYGQGVGYQTGFGDGTSTKRLFWHFNTSNIAGSVVYSASLKATVVAGSSSSTNSSVSVYRSGSISGSTTWNNQPSMPSGNFQDSVSVSSSSPPNNYEWNVKEAATTSAGSGWTGLTLGMKASETDPLKWKRFSDKVTLTVVSNFAPSAPNTLSINGKACSPTSTLLLGRMTAQPIMRATLSDKDGDGVFASFNYNAGSTVLDTHDYVTTPTAPSGSVHTASTTTLPMSGGVVQSGSWAFKVHGRDNGGLLLWGPYSTTCRFTIDSTLPPEPLVTPPPTEWALSTTQSISVAASDPADTTAFSWALNASTPPIGNKVTATGTGKTAVLSVTPTKIGLNTLSVWSYDAAGNQSLNSTDLVFETEGFSASSRSTWTFDGPETSTPAAATADDTLRGFDLTTAAVADGWGVHGRYTDATSTVVQDNVLKFNAADPSPVIESAHASGNIVQTGDDSFTVSAYLDPAVLSTDTAGTKTALAYGTDTQSVVKLGITPSTDSGPDGQEYVYYMSVWDPATSTYATVKSLGPADLDPGLTHVVGWFEASTGTLHLTVAGDEDNTITSSFVDAFLTMGTGFKPPTSSSANRLTLGSDHSSSTDTDSWRGAVDQVSIAQGGAAGTIVNQLHNEKSGIFWDVCGPDAGPCL